MQPVRFIRRPGSLFYSTEADRLRYKQFANAVVRTVRERRDALLAELPSVTEEFRIPRSIGFVVLRPEAAVRFADPSGVLRRCDDILNSGTRSIDRGKPYLRNFLPSLDVSSYPDFLDFALKPHLIASVADYLGELPVLVSIKFLHSEPMGPVLSGSQLYHCDHDDVRQVKLFLHVSNVDAEAGPLTVLPAWLSQKVRTAIGYSFGGRAGHVPDTLFRDDEVKSHEVSVEGSRGTVALVDTAQVFHFGSRVSTKDRLIFYLHYVSLSSFQFHPVTPLLRWGMGRKLFGEFPYSRCADSGRMRIQNAVLTGKDR